MKGEHILLSESVIPSRQIGNKSTWEKYAKEIDAFGNVKIPEDIQTLLRELIKMKNPLFFNGYLKLRKNIIQLRNKKKIVNNNFIFDYNTRIPKLTLTNGEEMNFRLSSDKFIGSHFRSTELKYLKGIS